MAGTLFENNLSPYISFTEHVDPSNPSAGVQRLFVDTDHILKMVDSAGTVTTFGTALADPMTTRGDIIVRNASNVTARLAIGSAGKVLSSDGTDVSWQTPSGSSGALVLLEQHTASSSATLDFTTFISGTYDSYLFDLVSLRPGTTGQALWMRMGTGGGPTYATANYAYDHFAWRAAASGLGGASGQAQLIMTLSAQSSIAGLSLSGKLNLYNPQSTSVYKEVDGRFRLNDGSFYAVNDLGGAWVDTTAVTAVRFLFASGNITSGTIRVYGIAK